MSLSALARNHGRFFVRKAIPTRGSVDDKPSSHPISEQR
jgi:hypothetical protein